MRLTEVREGGKEEGREGVDYRGPQERKKKDKKMTGGQFYG